MCAQRLKSDVNVCARVCFVAVVHVDRSKHRSSARGGAIWCVCVCVCVSKCLSYLDIDLFHFVHEFIFVYGERFKLHVGECATQNTHTHTKHARLVMSGNASLLAHVFNCGLC